MFFSVLVRLKNPFAYEKVSECLHVQLGKSVTTPYTLQSSLTVIVGMAGIAASCKTIRAPT